MHIGYLAAFATLFSWTISAFIFAKLTRLVNPALLNKSILFFSIFLLGIVVCVIDGFSPLQLFTIPNQSNWLWLGLSGIVGKSIGDYCGLTCLRILGPSRRYMIATLTPGFTLLFAFLILDEQINFWGIAGIFITITSLFMLLNNEHEKQEVKLEKFGNYFRGTFMGVMGVMLTAIAFVIAKKTMVETNLRISEFHGTWIRVIAAFIAIFIVDLFRKKDNAFIVSFIDNRQRAVLLFSGIVFAVILGLSFSLIAITRMEVAVAYTIFSLVPLTVMLVSALFLHKRIRASGWIYCLLAIVGVMLLVWRENLPRLS